MNLIKVILFIVMFLALVYIVVNVNDFFLQLLLSFSGMLFIAIFFIITADIKEALTDE